jgi:hypothetical protein
MARAVGQDDGRYPAPVGAPHLLLRGAVTAASSLDELLV